MRTHNETQPTQRTWDYRIPPLDYNPPQNPLEILHKDEHMIVLNKPAGLLSVPGKGADVQDSLELRVKAEYPEALLVHRLDMDTSGVFVMAMNKDSQRNLSLQFERRKTDKIYHARVWGHVKDDEGLIDLPLRCDWDRRPLQMVCYEHGKPAQTKYRVLSRDTHTAPSLRDSNLFERSNPEPNEDSGLPRRHLPPRNDDFAKTTLVELSPITGRSHQLRVHMAEIGYPIAGDCFYSPAEAYAFAPRLLLHAQKLTLHHPSDGARTSFVSDVEF